MFLQAYLSSDVTQLCDSLIVEQLLPWGGVAITISAVEVFKIQEEKFYV